MRKPTQDEIKDSLFYNKETGLFRWKKVRKGTKGVGQIAGDIDGRGYWRIGFNYGRYLAHHLAWLYVYGEWPALHIDHINHTRTDNRIDNLRICVNAENHKNMKMRKDNTSGITGITFSKGMGKWQTYIQVEGRMIHLGFYSCIDDAIKFRRIAEVKYNFHVNHGRKAA